MRFLFASSTLFLLISAIQGLATPRPSSALQKIFQFPNPTWVENIYATRNGSILVSLINKPELHFIHPSAKPATSSLVYSFPGVESVLGITELSTDVFAVITANYSLTTGPAPGSSSLWKVDLSSCMENSQDGGVKVAKLRDFPSQLLLNGAAAVNDHVVLLGDPLIGNLVTFDMHSGNTTVLTLESFAPLSTVQLGINGLKVQDGYVYYTDTAKGIFNRAPISRETGLLTEPHVVENLASDITFPDDFALRKDGTAYVASPNGNALFKVGKDGKVAKVVGDVGLVVLPGPTSATFGRTCKDEHVLYISTEGGLGSPINGTYTEGGAVYALRV